jgi:hypothetical protein
MADKKMIQPPHLKFVRSFPLDEIEWGILLAVAYSDIFDYPMTIDEVFRYLVGVQASSEEINQALFFGNLIPHYLFKQKEYLVLNGRADLIQHRKRRAVWAELKWAQVIKFGTLIAALPYVRMVAVTGALALDNVEPDADLDFLIVTSQGRLWLCRAMTLLVVHLARQSRVEICPNYFLTENSLLIKDRNLFTARELAQMVPVFGWDTYTRMRSINRWVYDYLPNSVGPPLRAFRFMKHHRLTSNPLKFSIEAILRFQPGSWLENWEMHRKINKLSYNLPIGSEFEFNAMTCKGHIHGHGERALRRFGERVSSLMNGQTS